MTDLVPMLERIGRPRVLVVGDLMLDRYTVGSATRVNPEAPTLVLEADDHEVRPGGAASVAALLAALEAEVTLVGIVGADAEGRLLKHLLADAGVATDAILSDSNRPTTVKERFMDHTAGRPAQHILRVDREMRAPLSSEWEALFAGLLAERVQDQQAVLISDYGKGTCTPEILAAVRKTATMLGVPLLVDPGRNADYQQYRGADLLKPNRAQAGQATGRFICSVEEALAAGRSIRERFEVAAVLVTLDRDGMALMAAQGPGLWLPTRPHRVSDITGAGDMVLAVLGLCRAAGWTWEAAARLANVAAGLEVERLGVAAVTREDIAAALQTPWLAAVEKRVSTERLALLAEQYRHDGRRIVFTNGCFDLLHVGHLRCLEEAARQGDVLIVALNSDAGVRRLKGPGRPVIPEADRAALVAGLGCVDHVTVFDEATPIPLLRQLRPDVLVKGGTYALTDVVGREVVTAYGGRVCVTGAAEGRSATRLLNALRAAVTEPTHETASETTKPHTLRGFSQ